MPDPAIARSQFVLANQYMIRQSTLGYVLNPPPANPAQPIGNTPLWCKSTPNGSSDQIYDETSTGDALYFPSYLIATDDAKKPKVKFTQPNKPQIDTVLTITLAIQTAPSQSQVANAAGASLKVCPPAYYADSSGRDTTVVQLVYSNGTKQLTFDVTPDPATGNLLCTVKMTDYNIIGEVIGTLVNNGSDQANRASVTVTRVLAAVGVAAGTAPAPAGGAPTGVVTATQPAGGFQVFHRPVEATRMVEPTTARIMIDRRMMMNRAGTFNTTGLNADSGFLVHETVHIPEPPPTSPPTPVYIHLVDQKVTFTIPSVWFLDTVSADIVGDVKGVKATQAGYRPHPVPGYGNPLLQDVNDETAFYYLPDAFKIARRDTPPFLPLMNVTISGTTLGDACATMFFTALPVVDTQKLRAAQDLIQKEHSGETITMQPLPTPTGIQYGMFLPGATSFAVRTVPVLLDHPLIDSPQLSLDDFQTAFASLTAPISQYLQGKITIPLGDTLVEVPLIARADDFPGLLFQQTRTTNAASTGISLVLTNAVESAVQVDSLAVVATRGGTAVPCSVVYDPPLPTAITPADDSHPTGGTLTVTVVPTSGPLDGLELAIDQSRCHVVPDAAGLLRAVLNPNVPVKASTQVTVVVPAVLFGSDTAANDQKILIMTMSFQNGNTIRFLRTTDPTVALISSDAPGHVNLTVLDYLLRQPGGAENAIKYKLAITYANGHTVTDSDWRAAPNDNFVLDLP